MNLNQKTLASIQSDRIRMTALSALRQLELPQGMIAAGFIRNRIWDQLYNQESKLTDVDVIYFDRTNIATEQEVIYEQWLTKLVPNLNWQVRNQARMHAKHNDRPYLSCMDAMSFWPEKQTAIAAYLSAKNQIELVCAFDISVLYNGQINHNVKRSKTVFLQRVESKNWLTQWPGLTIAV